ncbi:hypothetical protein G9A89_008794 [Geosiphon pyriformis]|nr:hypothetical protein G9A89_008794 [Geosiphon pyriformis]
MMAGKSKLKVDFVDLTLEDYPNKSPRLSETINSLPSNLQAAKKDNNNEQHTATPQKSSVASKKNYLKQPVDQRSSNLPQTHTDLTLSEEHQAELNGIPNKNSENWAFDPELLSPSRSQQAGRPHHSWELAGSTSSPRNYPRLNNDPFSGNRGYIPFESEGDYQERQKTRIEKRKRKRETYEQGSRIPSTNVTEETPWVINSSPRDVPEAMFYLDAEVQEFIRYISPRPSERRLRQLVVSRVDHFLKANFDQECETMAFGSFDTELYLPTSDLDIVVFCKSENPRKLVLNLAKMIKYYGNLVASHQDVIAIPHAKVPIVKLTERYTGFNIDISFNQGSGLRSALQTKEYLERYPGTKELVIAIKYFLKLYGLNDPANGGMGSYTVLLLVVSFLQRHPMLSSRRINSNDNLGILLTEFFELYGSKFNYKDMAISVASNGLYMPKSYMLRRQDINGLCIEDPCDPGNNVAIATQNWPTIRRRFAGAFAHLTRAVDHAHLKYFDSNEARRQRLTAKGLTILGSILFVDTDSRSTRNWLSETYHNLRASYFFDLGNDEQLDRIFSPRYLEAKAERIKLKYQKYIEIAEDGKKYGGARKKFSGYR